MGAGFPNNGLEGWRDEVSKDAVSRHRAEGSGLCAIGKDSGRVDEFFCHSHHHCLQWD